MSDNNYTLQDEVRLVRHMQKVVEDGLLGRNETTVFGEDPKKRFFSGVLFPSTEFLQNIATEGESDPKPQYLSIAKNHNMGLEFLVKPNESPINVTIAGGFNLYPRVFPGYEEQLEYVQHLVPVPPTEDGDGSLTFREGSDGPQKSQETQKGLTLAEKYIQAQVSFEDVRLTIYPENLTTQYFELDNQLSETVDEIASRSDVFSVLADKIHKTGTVAMDKIPQTAAELDDFINQVRSLSLRLPAWHAMLVVDAREYKSREGEPLVRLVISLINDTPIPDKVTPEVTGHPLEFFNASLKVSLNAGVHVPFEFDGVVSDYRLSRLYEVKGINTVGVMTKSNPVSFETNAVPDYFQPLYRTKSELIIRFEDLTEESKVIPNLQNIAEKMYRYLRSWDTYINNQGDSEQPLCSDEQIISCQRDRDEFEREIQSFELGIYSLQRDPRLMSAFSIMNRIFQRSGEGKYDSWRLFQIVFIVRILPSLFIREIPEEDRRYTEVLESAEYADVLWFPTGGGKTEAYLGLIVTALFYDRIRGKRVGCSAWLRFPLRMLSKQQLDRLARVLIFSEEYRQSDPTFAGSGVPFSIGYFAGSGNTENFLNEYKKNRIFSNENTKLKAMLLHRCPYCGGKLSLGFDEDKWKITHNCTNDECFVVKSKILKGQVPAYITDSEIYRFVPSVLCGTVDKLAILGRYREFSHLFGQVNGRCKKHGYYSDRCIVGAYDRYGTCEEKVRNTSHHRDRARQLKADFYDPVPLLMIQDELHLLKEELGALDSHYEGAINEFARAFGRRQYHLPKIIAATATIEAYDRHINHLYVRKARRYPSMGYKKGESFYATSTPLVQRRLYMGILPHTRALDEVINRCLYLYHKEIIRLRTKVDAWRSLGFKGIQSYADFTQLISNYDLSVVYVNQIPMGNDIRRRLTEATSDLIRTDSGNLEYEHHTEMLTGHNDMDLIVRAIDRIESEQNESEYNSKLHTLIATSLISHGVDLERINALFMAGMPSKQAEYIQASSRSARSHAGIVFAVFRANDLRERSQYQYFIQNHIYMDRLVDPVPINRLTIKAMERTIPGLISGLLLNVHSQNYSSTIYSCNEYRRYVANRNTQGATSFREEIIQQINRIIGTDWNYFSMTSRRKAREVIENQFDYWDRLLQTKPGNLGIKKPEALNPLTSFRDIEEGLPLHPTSLTSRILGNVSFNSSDRGN